METKHNRHKCRLLHIILLLGTIILCRTYISSSFDLELQQDRFSCHNYRVKGFEIIYS